MMGPGGPPPSKVIYVFAGQGAQWLGMGVKAYESSPTFRDTIRRLADTFSGQQISDQLLEIFEVGQHDVALMDGPALTAYQIAATNCLAEAGLEPSAVMGYSLGEVAAAYAAGYLSEADAFALSVARTEIARDEAPAGSMAVVGMSIYKSLHVLCLM